MRFALGLLLLAGCGGQPFGEAPSLEGGDLLGDVAPGEPVDDLGWVQGQSSPEAAPDVPRLEVSVHDGGGEGSDPPEASPVDAAHDAPEAAADVAVDAFDAAAFYACQVICAGCCDHWGTCWPGVTAATCGSGGAVCADCEAGSCSVGLCR